MNAKEKAKAIVERFIEITPVDYNLNDSVELTNKKCLDDIKIAKQCAIIAVNREVESITILSLLCNFDNKMKPILEEKIKELNEVKTEIQNL